ncbi:MAG: Eco57I restriction-modification methylase domain-containing protein [Bacteroidota bacterium]|nr:MAG: Eco57I restriction-modification methylase domain-containing protein [Bacteroidota bacterium]
MAANRIQLQNALNKPYDRVLFSREVLSPVFGSGFTLNSSLVPASVSPNKSESAAIANVWVYGKIQLDDSTEITCYEVLLQPKVRIEQSKVAIQQYVRKLLTAGQAALINFVAPANKNIWRLTLVAKDSVLTDKGVKEKTTNAKRYTFLLGPSETCKTAAERFETLSTEKEISFQTLVNAFSVEKLSKAFFDEYTLHYQNFCDYLQESNYRKSVFNITFPVGATKQEKDKASKPIRDFVKKLLGRIVFLYFVQKKGWLGANDINYTDGLGDFIKLLFNKSGGNDTFYSTWLTVLFFDTLNKERANDDFKMPDGKTVKVPFLNGGLFDKEEFDEHLLTFKSTLFHHPDFEDTILTEKSKGNARGFLDFLNAFNFTVYEDSPDDHTVAVDPEMLGHIFENLLEDNKDKGAFYTPKEIVHYMCQESLTEYLCTTLQIKDEVAEREAVNQLLKNKIVDDVLKPEITELEKALDNVKICDPAIGSGAFPMGLLQEIFSIKELIAYETGKEWKPAETKLNIIQNSIYGVDIEKGAVDIARLRFWLSLVVDEEKPKPLPNLDYKIVVGDSLISKFDGEIVEINWERKSSVGKADEYVKNVQRLLVEVADKQKKYFNPNNKNKKKLQTEIRNLKIELLINQLSFNKELYIGKTVQKGGFMPTAADIKHNTERELQINGFDNLITKLKNLLKNPDEPFNHFDWKLDFPEVLNPYLVNGNGGFDIVIGNPPFVFSRENISNEEKVIYKNHYSLTQFKINLYILFIEKGYKLLKNEIGVLFYITPNNWLTLDTNSDLRKFILSDTKNICILQNYANVFESASVDTVIIGFINSKTGTDLVRYLEWEDKIPVIKSINPAKYYLDSSKHIISGISLNIETDFILNIGGTELQNICDVKNGVQAYTVGEGTPICTEKMKNERVYHNSTPKDKTWVKYLDGVDVSRYSLGWSGQYIKYGRNLSRPREVDLFYGDRLLVRQIPSPLPYCINACYTNEHTINDNNSMIVKLIDNTYKLKYILGVLNSSLISKWFAVKFGKLSRKIFPQFKVKELRIFPIIKASKENQITIEKFVSYILFIKNNNNLSNNLLYSSYFEQIIDGMVYELYFPELLKKHNREIIKHLGELPEFTDSMSDEQKMKICKKVFDRLNDKEHPVRVNLFYMNSIPEIAIIEGKNENN